MCIRDRAWNAICPIRTKRGITVRLYEVKTDTKSFARRVSAAFAFTMAANPTNPIIAIRNPIGILVKMSTTRAARPIMPIAVGLISFCLPHETILPLQ